MSALDNSGRRRVVGGWTVGEVEVTLLALSATVDLEVEGLHGGVVA